MLERRFLTRFRIRCRTAGLQFFTMPLGWDTGRQDVAKDSVHKTGKMRIEESEQTAGRRGRGVGYRLLYLSVGPGTLGLGG